MTETRNWRTAKIPQWALDQINDELIAGALCWPTEAEPKPLPFWWGGYDRLEGEPVAGQYWHISGTDHVQTVHIRKRTENDTDGFKWKTWLFSHNGDCWTGSVTRGHLYTTERDARLALFWQKCRNFSRTLYGIRKGIGA